MDVIPNNVGAVVWVQWCEWCECNSVSDVSNGVSNVSVVVWVMWVWWCKWCEWCDSPDNCRESGLWSCYFSPLPAAAFVVCHCRPQHGSCHHAIFLAAVQWVSAGLLTRPGVDMESCRRPCSHKDGVVVTRHRMQRHRTIWQLDVMFCNNSTSCKQIALTNYKWKLHKNNATFFHQTYLQIFFFTDALSFWYFMQFYPKCSAVSFSRLVL